MIIGFGVLLVAADIALAIGAKNGVSILKVINKPKKITRITISMCSKAQKKYMDGQTIYRADFQWSFKEG